VKEKEAGQSRRYNDTSQSADNNSNLDMGRDESERERYCNVT
jgi:hypothetical protein